MYRFCDTSIHSMVNFDRNGHIEIRIIVVLTWTTLVSLDTRYSQTSLSRQSTGRTKNVEIAKYRDNEGNTPKSWDTV